MRFGKIIRLAEVGFIFEPASHSIDCDVSQVTACFICSKENDVMSSGSSHEPRLSPLSLVLTSYGAL